MDTTLLEGMTLRPGVLKGLALAFCPPNLCTSESDGATKRLVPLNGDPTAFPPGSHVVRATRPPVVTGLSEEMARTLAFLNRFSQASCLPNWRTPENNGAPKRLFPANGDPTLFGRASDEGLPKRPPVVRGLLEYTALTLAFPKRLPLAFAPPNERTLERQETPKRLSRSLPHHIPPTTATQTHAYTRACTHTHPNKSCNTLRIHTLVQAHTHTQH